MSRGIHDIEATNRPVAPSENREGGLPRVADLDIDELRRQAYLERTQLASDALRRRIRHYRDARGMSQPDLAAAMRDVGAPVDVSKIETGARRVQYDELLAFAYVLRVPLVHLMSPQDGELPIRAGHYELERHEVGNWILWGPYWTPDALSAQTYMRVTVQLMTMLQVAEDEPDQEKRREHFATIRGLLEELKRESPIEPGVMQRQALRDRMADGEKR